MMLPLFLGSLSILKALDREEQEVFNLTIVAEDHGIPQLSTSQVLSVQVIDVNDEAPVFQRAEFEALVIENKGPGTTVLKVTAVDRDQGRFKCLDKRVKHARVSSLLLALERQIVVFFWVLGYMQAPMAM